MLLSVTPHVLPFRASSLLHEVSEALAQDENLLRIKKLLLLTCTQTWENDLQRLEQASVPDLLQQLMTIAPTLEQLHSHLYAVAGSLNKAAEYTLIANAIITHTSRLYLEPLEPRIQPQGYDAIARCLSRDPELSRIKKLLLLAGRNLWEADNQKLQQISLAALVQEVHCLTPTLENLKSAIENLVKTLSKPAQYAAVGDRIILAFQPLYGIQVPPVLAADPATVLPTVPMAASSPIVSVGQQLQGQPQTAAAPGSYLRQPALTNLFDLRLELMRSANPFKVKILLFSILHEVCQPNTAPEQLLKHELDDLLRILLQTHKRREDLETKVLDTARLLPDSGDYLQVAQAVLQATRSLYAIVAPQSGDRAASPTASQPATRIVNVAASPAGTTEPASRGLRAARSAPEQTCRPSIVQITPD